MSVTHHLMIDGEWFLIPDGDVDALRGDLVAAVRANGGFVAIDGGTRRRSEALVTPASAVRWEHVGSEEPELASPTWSMDAAARAELEWWFETG